MKLIWEMFRQAHSELWSRPESRASAVSSATRRSRARMKNDLPEPHAPNSPMDTGGLTTLAATRAASAFTAEPISSRSSPSGASELYEVSLCSLGESIRQMRTPAAVTTPSAASSSLSATATMGGESGGSSQRAITFARLGRPLATGLPFSSATSRSDAATSR